ADVDAALLRRPLGAAALGRGGGGIRTCGGARSETERAAHVQHTRPAIMAAEDAIVESGMVGVSDVSSLQSLTHTQSLIPDPRIADPRIPNPESRISDPESTTTRILRL